VRPRYAIFITTIPLHDEDEPDDGISILDLVDEDDIDHLAREAFAELNASEGVSEPWLLYTDDELNAIEDALPRQKRH